MELSHFGKDPFEIISQPWLEIQTFENDTLYQHLLQELNEGETAAIVIAIEKMLICY